MKASFWNIVIISALALGASVTRADSPRPLERSISIVGRAETTVTTPEIRLSDIADISSPRGIDDDTVIGLKKITIEAAPAPGETLAMPASAVIEALRNEGVNLNRIGYSFPRVMSIKRASRSLAMDEIRAAIEMALGRDNKENIKIKGVNLIKEIKVIPGVTKLEATPFNLPKPGKMGFTVKALVENNPPVLFDVEADVDQWRQVPVTNRPVSRGEVIDETDLMMARLNLANVPRDTILSQEEIVGHATKTDLTYGELLRRDRLKMPAVIASGSRVTMIVKGPNLEATAKGTALEDGIVGQEIKVKNDLSRKVVTGRVTEAGVIEVTP